MDRQGNHELAFKIKGQDSSMSDNGSHHEAGLGDYTPVQ